ncbi:hypothetical protein D3C71_1259890 [compost metagenome]
MPSQPLDDGIGWLFDLALENGLHVAVHSSLVRHVGDSKVLSGASRRNLVPEDGCRAPRLNRRLGEAVEQMAREIVVAHDSRSHPRMQESDGARLVWNLGNVEVSVDGHAVASMGKLANCRQCPVLAASCPGSRWVYVHIEEG